jgi:hypothetical protein
VKGQRLVRTEDHRWEDRRRPDAVGDHRHQGRGEGQRRQAADPEEGRTA